MVLIIFACVFILENIFIYQYAKRMLGNCYISSYITTDRYISNRYISNRELEQMRRKVNSKFSKF